MKNKPDGLFFNRQFCAEAQNCCDRTFLGVVEGDDLDIFPLDVLPDVGLRPVGEGKDPDAFSLVDSGVVQLPHFRALVFGIPGLLGAPEGENPLLRSGFFLVPSAAAKGCRKAILDRKSVV